jgi:hypothetical protein
MKYTNCNLLHLIGNICINYQALEVTKNNAIVFVSSISTRIFICALLLWRTRNSQYRPSPIDESCVFRELSPLTKLDYSQLLKVQFCCGRKSNKNSTLANGRKHEISIKSANEACLQKRSFDNFLITEFSARTD